jgi:NADH-quinone oxidoreductase subunit G
VRALAGARAVVALSAYRNPVLDACAHVVLPIVPFTETSGSFVNCEGRLQGFNGAVPAAGEARPGWKVLRVLANELGLAGFDHESPEQVRAQALPADIAGKLDNRGGLAAVAPAAGADGVERLAGVAPYAVDAVVRRAGSLQRTAAARLARTARAHPETLARFGVQEGSEVRVRQGEASVVMACAADPRLAPGVVRIAAGTPESAALGAMSGSLTLERA